MEDETATNVIIVRIRTRNGKGILNLLHLEEQ